MSKREAQALTLVCGVRILLQTPLLSGFLFTLPSAAVQTLGHLKSSLMEGTRGTSEEYILEDSSDCPSCWRNGTPDCHAVVVSMSRSLPPTSWIHRERSQTWATHSLRVLPEMTSPHIFLCLPVTSYPCLDSSSSMYEAISYFSGPIEPPGTPPTSLNLPSCCFLPGHLRGGEFSQVPALLQDSCAWPHDCSPSPFLQVLARKLSFITFTASALRALFISLENAQKFSLKMVFFFFLPPTHRGFLLQLCFLAVGLLFHAAVLWPKDILPFHYRSVLFKITRS
jgi:hypothetical protein